MKTGIIIQARMSSTRLPGKVLKDLAGHEVIWHVVNRCQQSQQAQQVIVATTEDKSDDQMYEFCKKNQIEVFRGDLDNVLKRFYDCAKKYSLDTIVRITADCPLIDSDTIDESIKLFEASKVDYVSNVLNRNFPRGLDCEVFSFEILEQAYQNAATLHEKEHVTPYILQNGKSQVYNMPKVYQGNFRITLDETNDYELLTHLYDKFYQPEKSIDVKQVIEYLNNNPEVAKINSNVEQKHSTH